MATYQRDFPPSPFRAKIALMDTLPLRPLLHQFAHALAEDPALQAAATALHERSSAVQANLTSATVKTLTRDDFDALLHHTMAWAAIKTQSRQLNALLGPEDRYLPTTQHALARLLQASDPGFNAAALNGLHNTLRPLGAELLTELLALKFPQQFFHFTGELESWLKRFGVDVRAELPTEQRDDFGQLYFANGSHLEELRFALSEALGEQASYLTLNLAIDWLGTHTRPADLPDWREWLLNRRFDSLTRERLAARQAGEQLARDLLETKLGQFTESDLRTFLQALNADWQEGRGQTRSRFFPAFSGNAGKLLLGALPAFNHWARQLWTADPIAVPGVLAAFWARNELPGAGISLPSALLYLRDPHQYNIWLTQLSDGLRIATQFEPGEWRTAEGYQRYNAAMNDFREQYHLAPQELDHVLAGIVRQFGASTIGASTVSASTAPQKVREMVSPYLFTPNPPTTTRADLTDASGYPAEFFDTIAALLTDLPQLAFYGPPGTGKTWLARFVARWWVEQASDPGGLLQVVQFHPAYSYEDFIEGLRPVSVVQRGHAPNLSYPVVPGVFRKFCTLAESHPNRRFVLLLDELNRADLPRVLGELLYLLEYRDAAVVLPTSGEPFRVPPNLVLLATMNTADRSLSTVDLALRRRFNWLALTPNPAVLQHYTQQHPNCLPYLPELLTLVNQQLAQDGIDWHQHLGHSYLMHPQMDTARLERVWQHSVLPLLAELYLQQPERLAAFELAALRQALGQK